ncbi:unnamed protein product [Meganyctiphanes norvegica]|uniref:Uncharacterized protein n=1 Tax=Meganyctiphanes norvegica TaxID=48144 RepID=A0AAV2R423_MEGNR
MNNPFGRQQNHPSISEQKRQAKSAFCYDENIHTIEDLIAEVNKCQLDYDAAKKTNESLQDLLETANNESECLEKNCNDLQESVAERKRHNAQAGKTVERLNMGIVLLTRA